MTTLRSKLIRLAHANPDIRPHILSVLHTAGDAGVPTQPLMMQRTYGATDESAPEKTADELDDIITPKDNPWDLTTSKEGWRDASEDIGKAVDAAVKEIRDHHDKISKEVSRVMSLLNKYAEFGTNDGETHERVREKLLPYANRKH